LSVGACRCRRCYHVSEAHKNIKEAVGVAARLLSFVKHRRR
jgi:hypothetical protein